MSALAHEAGSVSGRFPVLLVTAALHAVLIAALMTARLISSSDTAPVPIRSWVDLAPAEPRPDPAPTTFEDRHWQPASNHLPDVPRWVEEEAPALTQPDVVGVPVEALPIPVAPEPLAVTVTEIGYRSTRSPDDFYPAASIRNGESGIAIVQVCVSPSGKVTGRPRVTESSGYARLDAAAVAWATEATRFTPATRNGEPVAACKGFRVNFTLRGN